MSCQQYINPPCTIIVHSFNLLGFPLVKWPALTTTNESIMQGELHPDKILYMLRTKLIHVDHDYNIHYPPTLETWHWCLGHANYQAIMDMVKGGLLKGMEWHTKHTLHKCELCIIGKQTKTVVPKGWGGADGNWAIRKLGKVWVDINRPHAVESQTGNK